jgi:hypothetical protein
MIALLLALTSTASAGFPTFNVCGSPIPCTKLTIGEPLGIHDPPSWALDSKGNLDLSAAESAMKTASASLSKGGAEADAAKALLFAGQVYFGELAVALDKQAASLAALSLSSTTPTWSLTSGSWSFNRQSLVVGSASRVARSISTATEQRMFVLIFSEGADQAANLELGAADYLGK